MLDCSVEIACFSDSFIGCVVVGVNKVGESTHRTKILKDNRLTKCLGKVSSTTCRASHTKLSHNSSFIRLHCILFRQLDFALCGKTTWYQSTRKHYKTKNGRRSSKRETICTLVSLTHAKPIQMAHLAFTLLEHVFDFKCQCSIHDCG